MPTLAGLHKISPSFNSVVAVSAPHSLKLERSGCALPALSFASSSPVHQLLVSSYAKIPLFCRIQAVAPSSLSILSILPMEGMLNNRIHFNTILRLPHFCQYYKIKRRRCFQDQATPAPDCVFPIFFPSAIQKPSVICVASACIFFSSPDQFLYLPTILLH